MQYYTNDFYNNSRNIQITLKYNYYFTLLDIRKFIENLNIQKIHKVYQNIQICINNNLIITSRYKCYHI